MAEKTNAQQQNLSEKLNFQIKELHEKYGIHFRADEYRFRGRMFIQNKGSLDGLDAKDFINQEGLELERNPIHKTQRQEIQKLSGTEPDKTLTSEQLGEQLKNLRHKVRDPETQIKKQKEEKIKNQIRINQVVNSVSLKE